MMRKLILSLLLIIAMPLFAGPNDRKHAWMNRLVKENFSTFRGRFKEADLDKTAAENPHISRIKVIKNQAYMVQGEKNAAYYMVAYLTKIARLPDLDFLYYGGEAIYGPLKGGAPVFCTTKKAGASQALYFVDRNTIIDPKSGQLSSSDDVTFRQINETIEGVGWDEMKNQLVWRGQPFDGSYTPQNWTTFRRGQLCHMSQVYPEMIDARFYNPRKPDSKELKKLWKALPTAENMQPEEHAAYKYQIVLDRTCFNYTTARWKLLSNSVVFMHETAYSQWYTKALKPWVHYVPVKGDLSDLPTLLSDLMDDEEQARQLAENARSFAKNKLMTEDVVAYCYKALMKYRALQAFRPKL